MIIRIGAQRVDLERVAKHVMVTKEHGRLTTKDGNAILVTKREMRWITPLLEMSR